MVNGLHGWRAASWPSRPRGKAPRPHRRRPRRRRGGGRRAVTFTPDDIDWDDEVRIALEERAAFSPDALTGMEASIRFGGPETIESKIFGRLSAWQNWIFQRAKRGRSPGALEVYGTGQRSEFDRRRV